MISRPMSLRAGPSVFWISMRVLCFAADERGLVEFGVAAEIGLEDVDGVGDFVAVKGHGGLEAEGVAGAEAAGEDAELAAGKV